MLQHSFHRFVATNWKCQRGERVLSTTVFKKNSNSSYWINYVAIKPKWCVNIVMPIFSPVVQRSQKHKDGHKTFTWVTVTLSSHVRCDGESDKIEACEVLVANHTVQHNQFSNKWPFVEIDKEDLWTEIIFSVYKLKSNNYQRFIAVYIEWSKKKTDLNMTKSIIVSLYATNNNNNKKKTINDFRLCDVFCPAVVYKVKIIDFTSLPDETSDLRQCAMLKKAIHKLTLKTKLLCCVCW